MQKKHLGYIIVASVSLMFVLMLSFNGIAAYDSNKNSEIPFNTDMTDRTMLKEILVNQGKTHALLKEIKTLLQEKK